MDVSKIYSELSELLCNQDKALKKLVWTVAQNEKITRPKNVLLVGELGSGKTTMVELVANKMNIPIANVSGVWTMNGFESSALNDAFSKLFLLNNKEGFRGIVLIEDMKSCFMYGGFSSICSLITSGCFVYNNRFMDVSDTMFIGEIDSNDFEDCFSEKPEYTLENLDDAFLPENCNIDEVKILLENIAEFGMDLDVTPDVYSDEFRDALRRTFLSIECNKVFNKKIFMERMCTEDICKALKSPVSEIHKFDDDLCEEYMTSPRFMKMVAGHIKESLVGLHDLDDAVQEVADYDHKRKIKVYKEDSLMRL